MKVALKYVVYVSVFLASACEQSKDKASGPQATQKQELELKTPKSRQVLSVHPEFGMLSGTDEPALENADHARIMTVTLDHKGRQSNVLDGVQDALFLGDGSILAVTRTSDLVSISHGQTVTLESGVKGPLSLAGDLVAYRIGDMGDYIPVVRNLETGERNEVTHSVAPAWQVALSESGKEMVFVSSHTSETTLIRVSVPTMKVLEEQGIDVVPIGPTAPIWRSDVLLFEAEEGLVRFHLPTRTWKTLTGTRPLLSTDGKVFVHDGGLREVSEVFR